MPVLQTGLYTYVGIRQMLQQSEDAFPEVPLINPHSITMPGTIKAERRTACLGQTATHNDVKTEQLCCSDLSNPGWGFSSSFRWLQVQEEADFFLLRLHISQIYRTKYSNLVTTEIILSDWVVFRKEKHVLATYQQLIKSLGHMYLAYFRM